MWAVATGVLELVAAVRLRREVPGELLLGIAGGASIVMGVLMLVWPRMSAFVIVTLLGFYTLFFGSAVLLLALRLRNLREGRSVPPPISTRTAGAIGGVSGSVVGATLGAVAGPPGMIAGGVLGGAAGAALGATMEREHERHARKDDEHGRCRACPR